MRKVRGVAEVCRTKRVFYAKSLGSRGSFAQERGISYEKLGVLQKFGARKGYSVRKVVN